MEITAYILLALVTVQLLFACWNKHMLPRMGEPLKPVRLLGFRQPNRVRGGRVSSKRNSQALLLSVLIPARNESVHIEKCLEHVLACRHEGWELEILVLDDRSEDDTADIVKRIAAHDPRVRLLRGQNPPDGWLGKSFACHQLAGQARGTWWLFLDADVRLGGGALEAAVRTAASQQNGLISGFPRQIVSTWAERLAVPMMFFTIISHLPIALIRRTKSPMFAAAMGAFMMIHRDTYKAAGGHEAIRQSIVDDMELSRAVKAAGHPFALVDLHKDVFMRMYSNAEEVWNGYRKNMFEGVGRHVLLLLFVLLLYMVMYVIPPLLALTAWFTGHHEAALVALAATLAGMGVKRAADAAGGQPAWMALLQPLSILYITGIGISSWYASASGQGYEWKGRRYS
ncbi:glycosyltransferase [Paenibacillus sp. JX-17]|uniref:4,4'-diaponeurosporenoate glycosyltransferase n=1 Tax=Paenibacillus lacisoli TaxID=3064525 RepID=A0ABT9CB64_9BACL|nr:glycosyltransferase [Paenibacillus sp. JX-17]MDO7906499.1 glycosyltransferase [Paenibacillus sp. JX-17]